MKQYFSETLKKLRTEKGLSRQELADKMFVTRSTVARWETGSRLPDAAMIYRLSVALGTDIDILLSAVAQSDECPNVIMVDKVMPNASVTGFTKPTEAIEYAKANPVALAFLDIEMGTISGLDVCRKLLEINPRINVVYLTASQEYSFDAWSTGACGFLLKPLTVESVRDQLSRLRYPVMGLS